MGKIWKAAEYSQCLRCLETCWQRSQNPPKKNSLSFDVREIQKREGGRNRERESKQGRDGERETEGGSERWYDKERGRERVRNTCGEGERNG